MVSEGGHRRWAVAASGVAAVVLLALGVPLVLHLSSRGGRSTVGLAAAGHGPANPATSTTAGTDAGTTAVGNPTSTAPIGPRPSPTTVGLTVTPPASHLPERSTTSVTAQSPAVSGNADLTIHVTATAIGYLRAHVHVVADDPDHGLPDLRWGPGCSGWSVDFGESGTQMACPAICQVGGAPPDPPPTPGHVDAAIDHPYGVSGTDTVTVRYLVVCGAAAGDPTLSGGVATATVAVT